MDFQNYLKQYDEPYRGTGEQRESTLPEQLPDSIYRVRVETMDIKRSKSKGLPQLVWRLGITEGTYKGRTVWKVNGLDTFEKIGYLKKDLALAGLQLKMVSNLENEMGQLINQQLEVTIKNQGKWQNVFIRKNLSSSLNQNNNVAYPF